MTQKTRVAAIAAAVAVSVAGGIAVALIVNHQPKAPEPRPAPAAQRSKRPSPTPTPKPSPGGSNQRTNPSPSPSHTSLPSASPTSASPTPSTPAPSGPPQEDFQQAFALWPRDTPAGARADCSSATTAWRDHPASVALRFAAAVLGWKHAQVGDIEGAAGSVYVSVTDGNDGIVTSLTGGYPGGPGGYPGNRCYSVTAVEPPAFVGKGNALRVHVHGVHARLSFKTLGASRMVVTVAHGSSSRSMIVNEGSVHMDLGPYPNEPGYALVLFRNSGGHDFSAIGLSLPSGSYPQG